MQYRMHAGLLEFPNRSFYRGKITSGVSVEKRVILPSLKVPNGIFRLLQKTFPSFFWLVEAEESRVEATKSFYNEIEASAVVALVKRAALEFGLKQS